MSPSLAGGVIRTQQADSERRVSEAAGYVDEVTSTRTLSGDDACWGLSEQGDGHKQLVRAGQITAGDGSAALPRRRDDARLEREQVPRQVGRVQAEADDTRAWASSHRCDGAGVHQEPLPPELTRRQPMRFEVNHFDQGIDR